MKTHLTCFITISMILLGTSTKGATFNVSTTQELREALLNAAQNGQSDTIILANGTYATTDDGGGTFIFLDNENYDLTIKGSSAENVVLNGGDVHQVIKINVVGYDVLITLDSLSIINGYSANSGGGGFYTKENLLIQNCQILENNSYGVDHYGGGFYVEGGSVTITGSNISNNSASASSFYNYGGGFCVFGVGGQVNITDSTISNNSTVNGHGGGFFIDMGQLTITDSIISSNSASNNYYGGGFYTFGDATISNSIIEGNKAYYGGGFLAGGELIVINSTIANNIADGTWQGSGGGFRSYGKTVIKNSIISDNSVNGPSDDNYGGGGFSSEGEVTLINSIIINNGIDEGIYLYAEKNKILNSVFLNNGTNHINGDIASTVTVYNNYLDESKIGIPAFKQNNINSGNLNFANQARGDFHIGAYSVLIDAGTIDVAGVSFPETDFDGYERIWGTAIDIGPFEFIDDDYDGLQNYLEDKICTDPFDADSDDDGIMDGDEDCDNDGFTNAEEVQCGSDPGNPGSKCVRMLPFLMLLLD